FRELVSYADEYYVVNAVVQEMAAHRLLTVSGHDPAGEPLVDISHEAVIGGWPRLRAWLDEDRAALRVQHRLTEAAEEWEHLERDEGLLYRGARLAEALEWRGPNEDVLNEMERAFLDASVALRDHEIVER